MLAGLRSALIIMLFIVGGGAVVLTVAAFFGDRWWLFDYAANFRWHLFWLLIIAAILYTLVSRGLASIVFLGAALINAWLIAPSWLTDQPAAIGREGVTIVHADIHPGVNDLDFALRWIFDTEADLIFVAGTTAERMGPLAEHGSPYSIIAAPENPNQAGIVILGTSPWTVESFTTDHFGEVVYRITVGSNDEAVDVVTAWGDLGSNSLEADKLAARLATVAEAVASASRPVAVIGNLGATRWTNDMRIMQATLGLRDATEGFGYLATSPVSGVPVIGGWIGIPIDIVLMTEEIMPLELKTGPDIGADHLPVTVVIGPAFQN